MSVQQIEEAIAQLTRQDLRELMGWLTEYNQQLWDTQLAEDVDAGRLDELLDEVDRECEAGLAKPI